MDGYQYWCTLLQSNQFDDLQHEKSFFSQAAAPKKQMFSLSRHLHFALESTIVYLGIVACVGRSDFIETPVKGPSRCTEDVSALPPLLEPRAAICWRSFLAAQRDRHHSSLRRRRNLSPPLPIGGRVSSARWRLALLPLLQSCRAAGGSSWPQRRLDARRQSRIGADACGIDPASQPGCGAPTGAGRACP